MDDEELRTVKLSDEYDEQVIGKCDICGDTMYSFQTTYYFSIKGKAFRVCPCCCIQISGEPKYKSNGMCLRNYTDEEMADFLTWVQQDAYAYGAVDGYGGMVYPNTYAGWLKWFGEEES